VTYGGESPDPTGIQAFRVRATVVYDRAVAFPSDSSSVANVSARAELELTPSVYDRFAAASNALRDYLQLAFPGTLPASLTTPPVVLRRPVANAHLALLPALTAAILTTERRPDAAARANIAARVGDPSWADDHPGWPTDVDFWFRHILRDYEVVRIPMEFGAPSTSPDKTRNPANGFLDLRKEIVVALAGDPPAGIRWGVADFGSAASGDVQHFDLATRSSSMVAGAFPPEVRIDVNTTAGVQQGLASLGPFDPGPVDGALGGKTNAAVNAFRATHRLPLGGIDDEFRAALRAAAVPF
jgi:hypothetical protein